MIKERLKNYYITAVNSMDIPNEFKRNMLALDRIPKFIDRVEKELNDAAEKIGPMSDERIKNVVKVLTELLVHRVQNEIEDRYISELKRKEKEPPSVEKIKSEFDTDLKIVEDENYE